MLKAGACKVTIFPQGAFRVYVSFFIDRLTAKKRPQVNNSHTPHLGLKSILLPVVLFQRHTHLINGSFYFALAREDAFMLDDDVLHQGVDQRLESDNVIVQSSFD